MSPGLQAIVFGAALVLLLGLQVYQVFFRAAAAPNGRRPRRFYVFGCRHGTLTDKAGDTFVLGVIAIGVIAVVAFSIYRNAAGESAAWTAVLMAIIGTIKEGRQMRSSERTIQQVTPSNGQGDTP